MMDGVDGARLQRLSVQTVDGLEKPFGAPGAKIELYVDGRRQQTIVKEDTGERTIKVPIGHKVEIVASVPDFKEQRIAVGPTATKHVFQFKGAGDPIVLIVATKDCEAAAVRAVCDDYSRPVGPAGDPNVYRVGRFFCGQYNTPRKVLLVTSGMGNTTTSAVATQALNTYPDLKHVLLVGIAGGCPNPTKPSEHVRLGDIVVPDYRGIIEYDFVKETEEGANPRNTPQKPSASMVQVADDLSAEALLGKRPWEAWIEHGLKGYATATRPSNDTDLLYEGEQIVSHPADRERRPGYPRVHRGAIASADALQKNPTRRDYLRERFHARAIEMEGSGVQTAAWLQGKDAMIIRGICDYCDKHKNDDWQAYASLAAAAYARAMIETLPDSWFP
jgi:nucleoside phosphorylase